MQYFRTRRNLFPLKISMKLLFDYFERNLVMFLNRNNCNTLNPSNIPIFMTSSDFLGILCMICRAFISSSVFRPARCVYLMKSLSTAWYFMICCTGFIRYSIRLVLFWSWLLMSAKNVGRWSWIRAAERGLLAQYWIYSSNFFSCKV